LQGNFAACAGKLYRIFKQPDKVVVFGDGFREGIAHITLRCIQVWRKSVKKLAPFFD
jgi:hypothetical protein